MLKKLLIGFGLGATIVAVPATAFADNCSNVSRPAPACWPTSCNGPVIEGNWVWLPSIGVPEPFWGFSPPGTPEAINPNGNYQNNQGTSTWLLAKTPYCQTGGLVNPGATPRTYTHGIQSGCGNFG